VAGEGELIAGLQYRILKRIRPSAGSFVSAGDGRLAGCKLRTLFGDRALEEVAGKVVLDFGCGEGAEAIELARYGARKVIGIDIREEALAKARQAAVAAGVLQTCDFTTATRERADLIFSIDAFEHFGDPAGVLQVMNGLLKPDGAVLVSFGPTWYHPFGGHTFSIFPWAHLIFSERALLRWRADFKNDGATRFGEVADGLNQITIGDFRKMVEESPFRFGSLNLAPIRRLGRLHNRLTHEFTTAIVQCRLVKRAAEPPSLTANSGKPAKPSPRRNRETENRASPFATRAYDLLATVVSRVRCSVWDWRRGVNTCGDVPVSDLQVDPAASRMYQSTHPYYLQRLFESLPLGEGKYDLVDFGSGKGRVLLAACAYPFRDVMGVELDPGLHAIAEANIARYRGAKHCRSVRSIRANILEWPIPPAPAVYFAFAPLNGGAMVELLKRICASVEQHPRDAFLAYLGPWEAAVVDRSGAFCRFSADPHGVIWRTK
jgi:cyclopropane fatty-acyl-phospholipid synthase-like methyltransferase